MRQKRAYRFRCYPTPAQAVALARTFGCARFVSNWAPQLRTDAYFQRQERFNYADRSAALTILTRQRETAWLNEVSSIPTQPALRHLDRAFGNIFAGWAKYPAFHKKYGPQSAEFTTSAFRWNVACHTLTLAKMDAPLTIRWSRPLPDGARPTTVTVSRDTAGRYFVSMLIEEEIAPLPPTETCVGIDLGLHDIVVLSTGEKWGSSHFFRQDAKRLARAQRRLAKKQLGSKNRVKVCRKVARIHARIADRRCDFLHQLSTRITREHQTICVERLRVKAVVRQPTLAQAIHDVGWGEFVRQLTYTAAWFGRTLIAVDAWYPSSKRCSPCGHVLELRSLDTRYGTCPACGANQDRDVNAAKNVLAAGRAVSAGGEVVRPGQVLVPVFRRPQ